MLRDDTTKSVINEWFELPDRQRCWTKIGCTRSKVSVQTPFVADRLIFLKVALGRSPSVNFILEETIHAYQVA